MYNPMDLTGRRILVTGASSGIGRAVAVMLGKLGAQLVLVARNEENLRETSLMLPGNNHQIVPYDLADTEHVESIFTQVTAAGQKLQGLVHAAGISETVPLQMTTPAIVHDILTVNFSAFLMLVRQYSKKKYGEGGSVVGISSIAALSGQPGLSAYCGSKGAMDAAVRALAIELVPRRIRVNSVVPSFIRTAMYVASYQTLPEDAVKKILDDHPMGMGEPEDIAHAVAFLLSDAARFITGTQLVVDGGYLA